MHRLFFDCETGGTDPINNAIMTIYFQILDNDFNYIDELDLKLKPDKPLASHYTKEALKVTGMNLGEHLKDPETITYTEGRARILEFLNKHKIQGKKCHFRPHGQNVAFDVNFIKFQLLEESEYKKLIHHTCRDTFFFAELLKEMGFLPDDMSTNLGALAEFFGIPPAAYHNAKEDIKVTIAVYKAMKECYSKDKNKALSGISDSILNVIEGR
jgi:DNA polymerase III alpha subunit (gram-positive type)